ncbi:UNVERIFIED_CONTAM: hypothetical protein RMT77_006510 [Armadillidium vulgare]
MDQTESPNFMTHLKLCVNSDCCILFTTIMILICSFSYGTLLFVLAILGFQIFWVHCFLSYVEAIFSIVLIYGIKKVSMKAVRCWYFFTVVVSVVNIVYALIVKVTMTVTWTYFGIQIAIGTGLFILVLIIDRHMQLKTSAEVSKRDNTLY